MTETNFNFLIEPLEKKPEMLLPEVVEPEDLANMTPRKFGLTILKVFGLLGGSTWLLTQAEADPRGFIELLKKILPRQIELDNLEGITVRLIDQYGNALEIDAQGGQPVATGVDHPMRSGQPQIATSGNPIDVKLKETYE